MRMGSFQRTSILFTVGCLLALVWWSQRVPPDSGPQAEELETTEESTEGISNPPARRTPARTEILYLFDVSTSFHSMDEDLSKYLRAIPVFGSTVKALQRDRDIPSPQRHTVGLIKAQSLEQEFICRLTTGATGLFSPVDSAAIARQVAACQDSLRNVNPEGATDISGALKFAEYVLGPTTAETKAVILLTDLEDALPAGNRAAQPDLLGICVAAVFDIGVGGREGRNPGLIERRLEQWQTTLAEWRIEGFRHWYRIAYDPQALSEFLRTCTAN